MEDVWPTGMVAKGGRDLVKSFLFAFRYGCTNCTSCSGRGHFGISSGCGATRRRRPRRQAAGVLGGAPRA